MDILTIDATWNENISLGTDLLDYLKKKSVHSVALFASVQFLKLDVTIRQLSLHNIKVLTTKAKRTHVSIQVLGCDVYHDSFEQDIINEADALLYIGDGLFHPKAILLSQTSKIKSKPILIWDPIGQSMRIITLKDVEAQQKRTVANLKHFISARVIGILVTTKFGQSYLPLALKLRSQAEKEGKKAYIFIDDTIKYDQFENYPFIQVWVNTACPRIGTDDHVNIRQPLINIREALDPIKALESLESFTKN